MSDEFDKLSSDILNQISFDEAKKIINKFDGADGKDDLLKKLSNSGKLNDDASNEIMNFVRKNNLPANKLDDTVDSSIFKQVLFFQDYSKKINKNLKDIETDNIMDTIINEDTIKKLKDSGVFNDKDIIDINVLSEEIPNFENLTPTDLMNIKKGEFPEGFPSKTQDIFKDIDSLGESESVINNLISKIRNKKKGELGLNSSITDIRKQGKNIKDKISELNGKGFNILNNAKKLPKKFKNKNFADLDISELADLKSILKKSELQDIQDVSKKLNDIDDFLLTDVDIGGQNLKRQVQFQDNLAEINRFQKKSKIITKVKKSYYTKLKNKIYSFFVLDKYSDYAKKIDIRKLKSLDKVEIKIFDEVKKLDNFADFKNKSFSNLSIDELGDFRKKLDDIESPSKDVEKLQNSFKEIKDVYDLENSFVRLKVNMREIDIRKENIDLLKDKKKKIYLIYLKK